MEKFAKNIMIILFIVSIIGTIGMYYKQKYNDTPVYTLKCENHFCEILN